MRAEQRTPDSPAPDKTSSLSARDAAISLGVNERTIAQGLLPATKRSGIWVVHPDDLAHWCAGRQRPPSPRYAAERRAPLAIVPAAPPFHVPMPRTPLIGREAAMHDLAARLIDPATALLTLTGPGGSGKTRLALAVASALRDRVADGIWFVACAPLRDPRHVLPAIAQGLGLAETPGQSAADQVQAWLAPKQVLLVLDNLEHLLPAAPDLAHLLTTAPGLTILATSRVALRLSLEQQIPVPPLALPALASPDDVAQIAAAPAVQLFVARTHRVVPAFVLDAANAADVAAICHRLDGLPLAIELAAAHGAVLPPHALREHLDRHLDLLADGPADHPPRLRSLRQAIAWSYDLLDPALQLAFRTLSVFVGGFTLAAAAGVLGCTAAEAFRPLATLQAHSLIVAMPSSQPDPRFTMLETIRAFGLARLEATGDLAAVRQAHAAWCLDLCRRARPHLLTAEHTHWGNVLTEDHANIRATMEYLAACEDKTQIIVFVGWLWNFWFVRNHFAEGIAWMQRALAWSEGHRTPERVLLLVGAGALCHTIGDQPAARRHNEEALTLYIELGLDNPEYSPLTGLAIDAAIRGDWEASRRLNETLLAILRRHEETAPMARPLRSITLSNMAWNCFAQGEIAEAQALANDALRIKRAIQFDWALPHTLLLLALIAERRGEAKTATSLYRESLRLTLTDHDLSQATHLAHHCTRLLSQTGDHERVALLIGATDATRERTGIPLSEDEMTERATWEEHAISHLRERPYDRLHRAGRAMSLEEMIATAQVAEVPPPQPRVDASWRLTPREREVLDLLIEGLTDREIAGRLFVSPRTVNAHVTNILAKMEVPNRRQAIQQARADRSAVPLPSLDPANK